MTKVVLDSKRRADFGATFRPGDIFVRDVRDGSVVYREIESSEPPLMRARRIKGRWVGADIKMSDEEIVEAIRRDRADDRVGMQKQARPGYARSVAGVGGALSMCSAQSATRHFVLYNF